LSPEAMKRSEETKKAAIATAQAQRSMKTAQTIAGSQEPFAEDVRTQAVLDSGGEPLTKAEQDLTSRIPSRLQKQNAESNKLRAAADQAWSKWRSEYSIASGGVTEAKKEKSAAAKNVEVKRKELEKADEALRKAKTRMFSVNTEAETADSLAAEAEFERATKALRDASAELIDATSGVGAATQTATAVGTGAKPLKEAIKEKVAGTPLPVDVKTDIIRKVKSKFDNVPGVTAKMKEAEAARLEEEWRRTH